MAHIANKEEFDRLRSKARVAIPDDAATTAVHNLARDGPGLFSSVEDELRELRQDITDLKTSIADLKTEHGKAIADLQTEHGQAIADLQTSIADLQDDSRRFYAVRAYVLAEIQQMIQRHTELRLFPHTRHAVQHFLQGPK